MTPAPINTVLLTNSINLDQEVLYDASYQRMLPSLMKLAVPDLFMPNIDIVTASVIMIGAEPEVVALRPQFSQHLPTFDATQIDTLGDAARAMFHANTLYNVACAPPDDLVVLDRESIATRTLLKGDVDQGVRRGLVNPNALRGLSGEIGYKNQGKDIQLLTAVIRAHWPQLEGKCAATLAELERAELLASRLLRVVALREQGTAAVSEAAEMRLRAYTYCMKLYDDVRRAVIYLRWHEGDADTIAPSAYIGRGPKGKATAASEVLPENGAVAAPTPGAPSGTPTTVSAAAPALDTMASTEGGRGSPFAP